MSIGRPTSMKEWDNCIRGHRELMLLVAALVGYYRDERWTTGCGAHMVK